MTAFKLKSPDGKLIVGTPETIQATSFIHHWIEKDGKPFPVYSGDTDVYWDSSKTDRNDAGDMLVEDENGDTWAISLCTRIPIEEKE